MTTEIEAKTIIKSILNLRCREGATLADIQGKTQNIWMKSELHRI